MAKSHGDWLSVPFEDTATRDALKAKYGCFAGAEAAGFPGVARSEEEPRWDEIGRDRKRSDEIARRKQTNPRKTGTNPGDTDAGEKSRHRIGS